MALRAFGPGLSSDSIVHRYGFDGNEPDEMLSFYNRCRLKGTRSTFAINTWYPEIQGGYYVNRSLFVLIDQAIRTIGLCPVVWDTFRSEGLVPVEGVGSLCESEDYLLVSSSQREVGRLQIFEFGGGAYYKDRIIFDFILPADLMELLVNEVETKSCECGVQFTREPKANSEPVQKRVWHWWMSRFWG